MNDVHRNDHGICNSQRISVAFVFNMKVGLLLRKCLDWDKGREYFGVKKKGKRIESILEWKEEGKGWSVSLCLWNVESLYKNAPHLSSWQQSSPVLIYANLFVMYFSMRIRILFSRTFCICQTKFLHVEGSLTAITIFRQRFVSSKHIKPNGVREKELLNEYNVALTGQSSNKTFFGS